jgi:anti-sigma factor RsiW
MMEKYMDSRHHPPDPLAEEDLHALVDGRLAPDEAAKVRQRLESDAHARLTFDAWQAQRDAVRGMHNDVPNLPLPASLVAAAERAQRARDQALQWWRLGGMAASLLLAFGMGWVASTQWKSPASVARIEPARHFAQEAAVAHAVFLPEVRHPVEVAAAQQDHLVQWLSKRLGRPLKIPVLTSEGYELVGGRLLPGDEGARAQFMYQNAGGQRITLYLGAVQPGAAHSKETAFRFLDDGAVPGFYWVDQGFGYAIAGQLPRQALQDIASAVYRQL